jgi:hypothetical protein
MTTTRRIQFGLLKGRVQIPADFDRPMGLPEFFGLANSTGTTAPCGTPECEEPSGQDSPADARGAGEK